MRQFFQFKKIRTRLLTWFLMVGIVPLLVSSVIISQQRIEVIKSSQFQKLIGIRDLKVREINNWLDSRIADVNTIVGDREVIDYTTNIFHNNVGHQQDLLAENVEELLQRYSTHYDGYSELFIINANTGGIAVSTDKAAIGQDKSGNSYFKGPLESNEVFIKDIYRSVSMNGQPVMTFSVPILCIIHEERHTVGVLVVRIDLEHSLYKLLINRTGMGKTGETLIVNKQAMALNELRYYENAPLNLKIQAEPAVNAAQGLTGIIEVDDYRPEPVLAAYTHIPRTGWGFVAKQDQKEVYASIDDMYRSTAIVAVLAGLGIILFGLIFAYNSTRPILNMVTAAKKMSAGDLAARASVNTADETNLLAESLNQLAGTVALQQEVTGGLKLVSDAIVSAKNINDLGDRLLQTYAGIMNAEAGAFYLLNKQKDSFEPLTSFGCETKRLTTFNARELEGEFGKAIVMKQIDHVKEIPEDTRFLYKTIYGNAMPRELVTIPLIVNNVVTGILTLASVRPFSDSAIKIINQSPINLNTGLSNILAEEETRRIAAELTDKNQELETLAEELQSQTEELQEQNIELDTQRSQVEEANRLKSEFLANMSHELRTPLNSIMALSKVLMQQTSDRLSDEESGYLEVVERNGRQLLALINDILDLSKIEAGQMDLLASEFSLQNLIEDFMESLQPLAKENGNILNAQIADDVPRMNSDQAMVHRILQNLIGNAIKFTRNGKVEVNASMQGDKISVAVQDTGIGISEESLPYIFDEFRQVDGSTTRNYEGTGLGLTIAYRAALLLGGDISVESKLDTGSTFTLTLPLVPPESISIEPDQQTIPHRPPQKVKVAGGDEIRLLIVEDQEPAVIQLRSILESAGFIVNAAIDGQAALDYLQENVPDGILLDLMMPGVDGFEVLERIRNNQSTIQVPVLVLTAKNLTKDELQNLRANNIHQLIQKGDVNPQELLRLVGQMVNLESNATASESKKEPSKPMKPKKSNTGKKGKHTLLIVEDNLDNLTALKAVLGKGYTVKEASDGEQGWEMMQSERPDLVLTDIMMPKLDGLALTRRAKGSPELKDIPIIAISGKAMLGDLEEILAAGCDDYISKPFRADELKIKITNWLDK